ncbi:HU family DNA-binding protein [Crocosphaera sp. XPORK-15E]|uniref:HU family DNA-binding protein n=1 Tax=Crocosphaera sp. XPORK-15E TaxID=3110247 RepID=UPI002B20D56B|nr:HU family DNA-binding protein [Crocosphaera sp. XPORK-15E]MEA5537100.1 HU family DNA-binding protein [Crocosphaera sp. XPORK-15E]
MSINKQELIRRIAQRNGQDSEVINTILEDALEEIHQLLKAGESVYTERSRSVNLRNFGTFYIKFYPHSTKFKFNPTNTVA